LLRAWALLVVGLVLLLAWDASGLDLVLTRRVGDPEGFAWRDTWLLSGLLHQGGRVLALLLLVLLAVDAWRPLLPGPSRALRGYWLGVVLVTALAVPALKQVSLTSCPWDLAEFGGTAFYRSHWLWSTPDGGPGRCFPSGHAVSAFAFVGSVWLWRDTRPRLARALAWAVAGVGLLFTGAQWLRGAHFLSHGLWSAWACLVLALLAQTALVVFRRWRRAGARSGRGSAGRMNGR
jgi:membrane-associated PAP2 superfamily phosphatase